MYCSQCGKQNPDDSKFCASCGARIGAPERVETQRTSPATPATGRLVDFTLEKRVNVNLAIASLIIGILGVVFSLIGLVTSVQSVYAGDIGGLFAGSAIFTLSFLTNVIVLILQTIVIFQWSTSLNMNIDNTRLICRRLTAANPQNSDYRELEYRLDTLKFEPWAFWVYLGLYFLGIVVPAYSWLFNIIGFVFLGIYLQQTFKTAALLQEYKDRFYSVYQNAMATPVRKMKNRNVFLTVLFINITLGIYWWYLLIAFSKEINEFLELDRRLRSSLG